MGLSLESRLLRVHLAWRGVPGISTISLSSPGEPEHIASVYGMDKSLDDSHQPSQGSPEFWRAVLLLQLNILVNVGI